MPKNKGKGGKNRRRGKNENEGAKRELILKEEGQVRQIWNRNFSEIFRNSQKNFKKVPDFQK